MVNNSQQLIHSAFELEYLISFDYNSIDNSRQQIIVAPASKI